MKRLILSLVVLAMCGSAFAEFTLSGNPGSTLDVLVDGKIAARYMYAHDASTPERLLETYQPYLHVFDAEGKAPITKGAGGQFTHHRGIFIGWSRLTVDGQKYDRWHMKGGEIVHKKFLDRRAGGGSARIVSQTHWNDEAGAPLIREGRTMVFTPGPKQARLIVDCTFKLTAVKADVFLDGDPEHAGIQYRPADEVVKTETVYVFPQVNADPKKDMDYPWVGETYTLGEKLYSVVHMNHPGNPKETKYSAYRDYGRFGAFFKQEIKKDETLTLKYRFMIADGGMPSAKVIQREWDSFAGFKRATPAPKTTTVKAVSKAKKPKNTKKKKKKK